MEGDGGSKVDHAELLMDGGLLFSPLPPPPTGRRNQVPGGQDSARKVQKLPNLSPQAIKYLWIRTALFEKVLDKIVHHLVENSR